MSRTMTATFLCRHLQNNNVKGPDSALSGEREPRRPIFNFSFKFIVVFQIQSHDSFHNDKESKRP